VEAKPKAAWGSLLAAVLFLGRLTAHAMNVVVGPGSPDNAVELEAKAPILSVQVKSFAVKEVDMGQALHALRAEDVSRIVIGFERIAHREGKKEKRISLELASATVGEIVRRLCEADSRYEYAVAEGRLIEVRPKGANKNAQDLLNIIVHEYNISRNVSPRGAIESIAQDAPELREFLKRKEEEWIKKTGIFPGSPGSIISGNMPPPLFTLHLQNLTVCQILNAISLGSLKVFHAGKAFGPTGWEYDVIKDPNATTTLGGYPRWSSF
jgi:hypothetical protein